MKRARNLTHQRAKAHSRGAALLRKTMTRELPNVVENAGLEVAIVVDNDAPVRRLIFTLLNRLGYSVVTARDGADALHVSSAAPHPITLAVIELELPDARGLDLARQLGAMHPGMRVVFVGADAGEESAYTAPPTPLLRKPFHPRDLARLIDEAKHARAPFFSQRTTSNCGG